MKILFLQTGGTIDKDYPAGKDNHGYSFLITTPACERILKRVRPDFDFEIKTVLQKDSLDISDEDRDKILDACKGSTINRIVITHGTDTMLQTAQLLSELSDKTIVLTGALTPELFKNSDADFNLGTAIGGVTVLDPGIYIAMNGSIMHWDQVYFDSATSRFMQKTDD
jgi:L-asparaginase